MANKVLIDPHVGYDKFSARESVTLQNFAEPTAHIHLAAATQPYAGLPDASAGSLILVAEDNEFTAETMSDYLHFHGFHVNLARDGYEVIDQAISLKPQLIIMDIQMPGINGFDAMLRLRAETATAKIPIIALTALAMVGDRERCLAAGATAYFSKPLSLRQLINTIETFLSC